MELPVGLIFNNPGRGDGLQLNLFHKLPKEKATDSSGFSSIDLLS
jgi:hypothetical protein